MAEDLHQQPAGDLAGRIADAVSIASDFGAVWVALSVLQVARGRRSLPSALLRLGSTGVASLAATRALKHYFAVPRQLESSKATRARTPSSPGFPSGHTLAAFASALTIPARRGGTPLALVFAATVAWARVRVGHHRASDVVAGAGVGTVTGAALRTVLPGPA